MTITKRIIKEFKLYTWFRVTKILFAIVLLFMLVLFTVNIFSKEPLSGSIENLLSERIISLILLLIGSLYFLDVVISLYNQKKSCEYDFTCKESYSVSEYLKHSVVIFFLAFSLGVLGSLEVISSDTDNVTIQNSKDYINKFENCLNNYKIKHDIDDLDDFVALLPCTEDTINALTKEEHKGTSIIIYTLYNIFQNVLIALIAIELTTAYFISGHSKSQSLVTGLLIAAIIDIISFVTLKTVIAQPNLPSIEIPRYHIQIGYMLGYLSVLSFLSSFEAVQYSQIKVDHALGRFNILKQLGEIIKNGSSRNRVEIESTLQDYAYIPRTRMLTELLRNRGFVDVKCEMFHDLYGYTSFFKEDLFEVVKESLKTKGFKINEKGLKAYSEKKTNAELLKAIIEENKIIIDNNSLISLYYCLVNEVEIKIVMKKSKGLNENEARIVLEIAGFQTNRHRHEETIELIIDYYVNSKYKNKVQHILSKNN